MLRPVSLCTLALMLAMTACGPQPECQSSASCISPELHVDACAEEPTGDVMRDGVIIGGTQGCRLDFGAIAARSDKALRLTNGSFIDVAFAVFIDAVEETVELSLVGETRGTIVAGQSVDVVVRAEPRGAGAATLSLGIISDAANIPGDDGSIAIDVTAESTP